MEVGVYEALHHHATSQQGVGCGHGHGELSAPWCATEKQGVGEVSCGYLSLKFLFYLFLSENLVKHALLAVLPWWGNIID